MPTSPTTPDGDTTSVIKTMSKVKASLEKEDLDRNSVCESLSEHDVDIEDDDDVSSSGEEEECEDAASPLPATDPEAKKAAPEASSSEDELVLKNVRVRIQKRPTMAPAGPPPPTDDNSNNNTTAPGGADYEVLILPELRLPKPVSLEGVRHALTHSVLGDSSRDIFFPTWTKSLYITWNESGELETIESDEALAVAVEKVDRLTLLLQECRNARYSRRKPYNYNYNQKQYRQGTRSPFIYHMNTMNNRMDGAIYFDNPTYYVHPAALAAAYGCVMPQQGTQQQAQQYTEGAMAYMPAPFMVPFMYAPPQH